MIMGLVKIKERGPTPRKLAKLLTAGKKEAWYDAGRLFHSRMRDRRFTEWHARAAGYAPRSRAYVARKARVKGHRRPLEYSGDVRRRVRQARLSGTSKGVRVAYAGARKLNLRHPKSRIRMAEEFRRVTRRETGDIAKTIDRTVDRKLNTDQSTTTREV